jgi:hypothetical protein
MNSSNSPSFVRNDGGTMIIEDYMQFEEEKN